MHTRVLTVTSLCLLCALVLSPGCGVNDILIARQRVEQVNADLLRVQAGIQETLQQKAQVDEAILAMEPGPLRDQAMVISGKLAAMIEIGEKYLRQGVDAAAILSHELENARDETDIVDAALKATAPLLPPPWNLVAIAAGSLGIGLWRAARNKALAVSLAKSTEPIIPKDADGKVTAEAAAMLDAGQSAAVKAIVDIAQGDKKLSLPF